MSGIGYVLCNAVFAENKGRKPGLYVNDLKCVFIMGPKGGLYALDGNAFVKGVLVKLYGNALRTTSLERILVSNNINITRVDSNVDFIKLAKDANAIPVKLSSGKKYIDAICDNFRLRII